MSAIDTSESPILAAPRRPEGRLTFRQFLRVVRENTLATYPPEDFSEDILVRRLLWRRTFIVNEPGAIRHVLLDNAQNYTKSEIGRRILEPGLGRGLLTSEGETWRRHRRIRWQSRAGECDRCEQRAIGADIKAEIASPSYRHSQRIRRRSQR